MFDFGTADRGPHPQPDFVELTMSPSPSDYRPRCLASWSFSHRPSSARVAFRYAMLALMTAGAALLGPWGAPAAADERPNILFFFTDDQPHDALGSAGHPILETPHLDRLAEQGVRFSHAFVSTSICWVSRATVLTGMWSRSHGRPQQIDVVTDEAASTMYPKLLHEAGYRNGFFGKWHAKMPRGFDQSRYFDQYENIFRNPYFKEQPDGTLRHETDLIGDRAVAFLRSQPADQPFCLHLWFNAPHAEDGDRRPGIGHFPWPPSQDGQYEDVAIPLPRLHDPAIYESQPSFLKNSLNRERFFWRWDTPEKYETNMRAYFRMLSGIDAVVGRVRDELESLGLADNTVIVFSSDNGFYLGNRGFAGKWSHYDESVRVPLIIYDPRLPGAKRGRVEPRFAINADLAATFLDLAGLEPPERYEGPSLMPLVYDQEVAWRDDVFLEHLLEFGPRIPKWDGVRGQRYVYAHYFEYDFEFLHDLQTDPDQLENLIDDPAYGDVVEQLRQRHVALRESYGGPYVSPRQAAREPVRQGAEPFEGPSGRALRFDGRTFLPAGQLPQLGREVDFTWTFRVRILPGHSRPGVLIGNRNSPDAGADTFLKFTSHSFQAFRGREHALRLEYPLPPEEWVHVAAVKRGPEVTVYLGGQPVASGELPADLPSLPFFLGGDPHANELSTCELADVRLYHQALSAEQIRQQATAATDAPESPADEASRRVWTEALQSVLQQEAAANE